MAHLVRELLPPAPPSLASAPLGRLRLVDATALRVPGSRGTDYRLHLTWDLQTLAISALELTDARGAESLERGAPQPGDLLLADRGYPQRRTLALLRQSQAHLLVRFPWRNLPLLQPDGQPFDLLEALDTLPQDAPGDFPVWIAPDPRQGTPALPARLVALRREPEQVRQAQAQARATAQRKQSGVDPRTLRACEFFFVLTSLPPEAASAAELLELYRFRWQVELCFKRLKSLLQLSTIPAQDPRSVEAFLWAKLLAALLLQRLRLEAPFSPWEAGLPGAALLPVASGEPLEVAPLPALAGSLPPGPSLGGSPGALTPLGRTASPTS
ncbi:MAG TPA: IS4 family transposase [Armatimonadota bacterium]